MADWKPGDVARLEDGHLVALTNSTVLNPWVGLTWEDESPATPFLDTEEIEEAGASLVFRDD